MPFKSNEKWLDENIEFYEEKTNLISDYYETGIKKVELLKKFKETGDISYLSKMSIDTTGAFEYEFEQIYDNTWSAERNQASIDAVNKKYGLDIKIEK